MELSNVGKMMVFVFCFLATFITLLGIIPSQFVVATKDYSLFGESIPEVWHGIDLLAFNLTDAYEDNLTATSDIVNFDIGGRNLQLTWDWNSRRVRLFHRYGAGLLWSEAMDWYNRAGEEVSSQYFGSATVFADDFNEDYADYDSIQFRVVCEGAGNALFLGSSSYFELMTFLAFNTTTYATPEDAWAGNELTILIGIEFDQTNTALNAWYIVSALLTFNTLEVFGNSDAGSIAMNAILAFPFWASIAFISFVVIMELIPF